MTTKNEFRFEFRVISQYPEEVLSNSEFEAVMSRAEKHIRSEKPTLDASFDFLSDPDGEEALFWYTCLFAKVATGELDSQDLQVGAVDQQTLLAKEDDEVTTWYRNAIRALRTLKSASAFRSASPARDNRVYQPDSFSRDSGGSGSGGSTDFSL